MRRALILMSVAILAVASAMAIPYASYIRVSSTAVAAGGTVDISYVLNEGADSVTIDVVPALGGAAVATVAFNSGSNIVSGEHTVTWDLTDNFAGGTPVSPEEYAVEITVDNVAPAGWTQFAATRSVGVYGPDAGAAEIFFDGYSGKDLLIQTDPDSPLFGLLLASSAYDVPLHAHLIPLRTDIQVLGGGDGLSAVTFANPFGRETNQSVWGSTLDPVVDDLVWVVGQSTTDGNTSVMATLAPPTPPLPTNATDADPTNIMGVTAGNNNPRGIAVAEISGTRYAFMANGSNRIDVVQIDSNNQLTGTVADIVETATTTRYSKDVEFDAAGNLYWANRSLAGSGVGGRVYRWDAADVAAAVANPVTSPLTDLNADWVVDVPAASGDVVGVTIDPNGNVYTANATGTPRGIYLVGNVSTASLVTTLTIGARVVDFETIETGWTPSGFGTNVKADAVGNLYVTDTSNEQVRGFGPGGTTSETFPAPTSQNINVFETTGSGNWDLYR